MNKDRQLKIPYDNGRTKQIDVFAVDEETVIFVECKCAQSGRKSNFKNDIQALRGIKEGLFKTVRQLYPNRNPKYIFATKNYELTETDKHELRTADIRHFDEYTVRYFTELGKHLGACARYQLLGNLFAGKKISAMETRIPAIQGRMGGYVYYSFSIEPERLLKIAYILHRNEANHEMFPTYQRLVKKSRLAEISKFINDGGFFPNSIIISIDSATNSESRKGVLQFDLAKSQMEESISKIGILHLPALYRSAYIIDGQHRLYGYADSNYAKSNSIPVVAFVDLDQNKQIQLFMEINENQKSVPKNLQNTLNADLLWDSPDWNQRRKALRLHIAHRLGEAQGSPLFDRVVIAESEPNPTRNISTETIDNALKGTNFLTTYKNNVIVKDGTLDKGENLATEAILYPFIEGSLAYIKEKVGEEWSKSDGVIVINNSIYGIIKVLGDILDHLVSLKEVQAKSDTCNYLLSKAKPYLEPLINYFLKITDEQKSEIRSYYGSGGKPKVWRLYQRVISESKSDFLPEGLEKWIRDNSNQYNEEAELLLQELTSAIDSDFARRLEGKYGANWQVIGLPPKVYKKANKVLGEKNYSNSTQGINENIELWNCVSLADYPTIAIDRTNWTEMFEMAYTRPDDVKIPGGKKAKIEWLSSLAKMQNRYSGTVSVTEEDYLFIKSLHDWFIGKT